MEYNPFNTNATSSGSESGFKPPEIGDKDKNKKDSKKSKAIGSLAFEYKASADPASDSADKPKRSLFDMLSTPQDEEASSDKSISDETKTHDQPGETVDATEAQSGSPELTDIDRQAAAQQIAEARLAEISSEPIDDETISEEAAVQEFYEQIIENEATPEDAAAEVMDTLATDVSSEDRLEEPEDLESPTAATPPPQPSPRVGPQPQTPPRAPVPTAADRQQPPASVMSPDQPPVADQQLSSRMEHVPYVDRSRAFSDAMVGGLVGYFIGRRRGRIKTERKLIPVQKKLEREITSLTHTIATQEFTIREAARQRVREQPRKSQPAEVVIPLRAARGIELPKRESRESVSSVLRPSLEREREHVSAAPPEHIGKVIVAAEAAMIRESGKKNETSKTTDERTAQKRAETLSRNDLLTMSEKINVEGSTLRQVYETHLISERGLRRLVAEYLRGGDVVRAFKRELIERQMDFERDPKLRDAIRKNIRGGGGKSPTLQKLLAQAGVITDDETLSTGAKYKANEKRAAQRATKRQNKQKIMDASLVTIIAVLLAIIIVLAIKKM